MSLKEEFRELKRIIETVWNKYWTYITIAPAAISFSISGYLFKNNFYLFIYNTLIIYVLIFVIIMSILVIKQVCSNFKQFKICQMNYKLITNCKNEVNADFKNLQNKSVFIDTPHIMVNPKTIARYSFVVKISNKIKKKLDGNRFTIVIKKPLTVTIEPWARKKKLDQKFGMSPDGMYICLDQMYVGGTNELKFSFKIMTDGEDNKLDLEIFFDYDSKIDEIENGNYKLRGIPLHIEPIRCTKVKIK